VAEIRSLSGRLWGQCRHKKLQLNLQFKNPNSFPYGALLLPEACGQDFSVVQCLNKNWRRLVFCVFTLFFPV